MRSRFHAYARHIYSQSFRTGIRTLKSHAFSSKLTASYVISIRQASALPTASFRFHLAMDTLAVQLTISPCRVRRRLSLPSKSALPGATNKKQVTRESHLLSSKRLYECLLRLLL